MLTNVFFVKAICWEWSSIWSTKDRLLGNGQKSGEKVKLHPVYDVRLIRSKVEMQVDWIDLLPGYWAKRQLRPSPRKIDAKSEEMDGMMGLVVVVVVAAKTLGQVAGTPVPSSPQSLTLPSNHATHKYLRVWPGKAKNWTKPSVKIPGREFAKRTVTLFTTCTSSLLSIVSVSDVNWHLTFSGEEVSFSVCTE